MIPRYQLISLAAVKRVGARKIRALLRNYPKLDDLSPLSRSDLAQVEGISRDLASKIHNMDTDHGNKVLQKVELQGDRFISYFDNEYPELLKTIYDAPMGLYIQGNFSNLPALGIVGTRQPSPYGKNWPSNYLLK